MAKSYFPLPIKSFNRSPITRLDIESRNAVYIKCGSLRLLISSRCTGKRKRGGEAEEVEEEEKEEREEGRGKGGKNVTRIRAVRTKTNIERLSFPSSISSRSPGRGKRKVLRNNGGKTQGIGLNESGNENAMRF